jgi:predicted nucleic acid-binding protein
VIYIDTGAFIARYVVRDNHHESAVRCWKEMEQTGARCFTSNFVLDEAFTLLARRTTYVFAADRARHILASPALTILRPGAEQEGRAVELFEKYADQDVSFTDCISFVLMVEAKLKRAFTFDRHFQSAGFTLWPG